MSSKEAKAALKEAREAVKNKKFSEAIKLCNKVLQEQKDCYMALLLLGAAYQDSDKKEAATHLRHAVNCSDVPTVALQGLLSCADDSELPEVCGKLLTLTPDKYADIHAKLYGVAARGNVGPVLRLLEKETQPDVEEARQQSAYEYLGKIVTQYTDLENTEPALVSRVLEREVRNIGDFYQHDKYSRYLKLLHREKRFANLASVAAAMHECFPNDIYPLEWICTLYNERILSVDQLDTLLRQKLEYYLDQALAVSPNSSIALLAKGTFLFNAGQLTEAESVLRRANEVRPLWNACLAMLADIYFRLKSYGLAENLYRSMNVSGLNYAIALMEDESMEKLREADACFAKLHETDSSMELLFHWCKANILLGDLNAAEQRLQEMDGIPDERLDYLRALRAKVTGDVDEAIKLLSSHPDSSYCLLELSNVLGTVEGRHEESFVAALQATKLDPSNSACYYRLGKLYQGKGDELRARKCLEKSVHLSPATRNAVILLSDLYRKYAEWDANAVLLKSTFSLCSGAAWAQLLLGLHHLGREEPNEAITAFRTVLRYEVDNSTAWEGLADAYLCRGSYSSAMKVFEKITERDPTNPYPLLQLANIKNTVKLHEEARVLFQQLLVDHTDYFPAVKGIADSHMGLCFHKLNHRLLGSSRDHAQLCVEYLTKAIKMKPNFVCLWHQLAKVLDTVATFPSTHSYLEVDGGLAGREQQLCVQLKRIELAELAAKCYGRILKQNPDSSIHWYELASNHYRRAMELPRQPGCTGMKDAPGDRHKLLDLAQNMAKQCIRLDSGRWQNWNLLGVICTTAEVNNLALAQHCFIEAVTVDMKTAAAAWCNLGVLYLVHGQLHLANKAFTRAQQCDMTFMNAWIGQAMIAENVGQMDEAMDLFRHCTQLGYHRESALGYAHWVCTVMNDDNYHDNIRYRFVIDEMAALAVAHDSITWYCADLAEHASVPALRFLGNVSSRLGLWRTASDAYRRAADATANPEIKDQVLCELGHCLMKQQRHAEAVQCYESMRGTPTYDALIGRAQAYFRAAQFEQSYTEYEQGLNYFARTDAEKAYVLIAMSAMVYAFQGQEAAKNVLYQCIALPHPPIEALFSACALGILHDDGMLTELVIKELRKYENDPTHGHHVSFLISEFRWRNKQEKKCYTYLSQLHRFPHRPKLWQLLAMALVKRFRTPENNLRLACKVAQGGVTLDLADRKQRTRAGDAARWLAVASEAIRPLDDARCRILAQKALHVDPTNREAWGAFQRWAVS